jgi:hypothetical protein
MIPKIEFDYDKKGDVLYISFGTGEPSYCDNVDDILVIEYGIYSKLPTGIRILDVNRHGIKRVKAMISRIAPKVERQSSEIIKNRSDVFGAVTNRLKETPDLNSISA